MSKALTGTVQGGAKKRSISLKGEVLIDGVQHSIKISGFFEIVNDKYDNLYVGEFSTNGLKAIFCITLEGEGVFIAKEAKGPFAGLESGGIKAEFSQWIHSEQNWNLTFGPISMLRDAILVLDSWAEHAKGDGHLVGREVDKLQPKE